MSKKINSIKQLTAEKKRLQQRQAELEKAIRYDWRDVKESLQPKNVAGEVLSSMFGKKEATADDSLAEGLSHLAASLTKIAVEKAEEKVKDWLTGKSDK